MITIIKTDRRNPDSQAHQNRLQLRASFCRLVMGLATPASSTLVSSDLLPFCDDIVAAI
jgi:hypothetical protein